MKIDVTAERSAEHRTRDEVARLLLEQGPATAASLGSRLGLSSAAVRRHLEAMQADVAGRRVEDFYYLSRATLVKDERNLDKFDRVFGHVFKGFELMQDALAAGGEGLRLLGLQGAVPVDGGVPILIDGKIVGAIGLSGGTSAQDGQCAAAGAAVVK